MAVYNDMTPADIAAVTGNNNRNNGMWGGDWAAWIVLFLIFGIFGWGGMGFGGFGGFGGGMRGANSPGFQGYATRADINEGFALNGNDMRRDRRYADDTRRRMDTDQDDREPKHRYSEDMR